MTSNHIRLIVAALSGAMFTGHPLCAQRPTDGNFYATSFGVLCNGAHDDSPGFTAALNAAAANYNGALGGGRVFVPSGSCVLGSQLIVPTRVRLVGANMGATNLIASQAFPANTAVIAIGDPSVPNVAVTFSSVSELSVSCNNIPGCTAIFSNRMQEGCYIESVAMFAFQKFGIDLTGYGVQNSYIRNIYSAGANGATGAVAIHLSAAQSRMVLEKMTLYTNNGSTQQSPAILLENYSAAAIRDLHCEQYATCIKLDSGSTANIDNAWGNVTAPTVVTLSTTSAGVSATNITPGGSATIIDDQLNGIQLPMGNQTRLQSYTSGADGYGGGGNVLSSSGSVVTQVHGFQIFQTLSDPGCKMDKDLGKSWENIGSDPTKLMTCQRSHGVYQWK